MRLWSDQLGAFIEAESLWNGRDSLTSGDGFHIRGSYMTTAAPSEDYAPAAPSRARPFREYRSCGCGRMMRVIPGSLQSVCHPCRQARKLKQEAA